MPTPTPDITQAAIQAVQDGALPDAVAYVLTLLGGGSAALGGPRLVGWVRSALSNAPQDVPNVSGPMTAPQAEWSEAIDKAEARLTEALNRQNDKHTRLYGEFDELRRSFDVAASELHEVKRRVAEGEVRDNEARAAMVRVETILSSLERALSEALPELTKQVQKTREDMAAMRGAQERR